MTKGNLMTYTLYDNGRPMVVQYMQETLMDPYA